MHRSPATVKRQLLIAEHELQQARRTYGRSSDIYADALAKVQHLRDELGELERIDQGELWD